MTFAYRYGGKKGKRRVLKMSNDLLVVRLKEGQSLERMTRSVHSPESISSMEEVARFPDANVIVMRVPENVRRAATMRNAAKAALQPSGVRFVGRALRDPKSKQPVLYTENFFVKFAADRASSKCKADLKKLGLVIKNSYQQIPNAFFVGAKEGVGAEKIFDLGETLLEQSFVEFAHPELIRPRHFKATKFANQWHLKKTKVDGKTVNAHANVEAAWELSRGKGVRICVIDDGIAVDHQDFSGAGKVIHGRDVTEKSNDPRPKQNAMPILNFEGDAHGTPCAGVACANGKHLSAGVAPDAKLIPIRLASGLGSMEEHDAFVWAADHGADVISCSWGPQDGAWFNEDDPLHNQVVDLPDSTRVAIEYAIENGRDGKGCVITWAAGNGAESADNDGYASNNHVMAIAACSDRGKRSVYSDFGKAVWCSFPSSNFAVEGQSPPLTPGIWTTDREGDEGYNPHFSGGDDEGLYTDSFGGTSSACPGVAGVAALMLAANPNLDWVEVANLIADTCDQIDKANGKYDDETGHSHHYGFGRVNAKKAVEAAIALI